MNKKVKVLCSNKEYGDFELEFEVKVHNSLNSGCQIRSKTKETDGKKKNDKFGQKLDYLTGMRDWFRSDAPKRSILVGDLNIAPREDDVWSHRQLLKIVSHTPIEVDHLAEVQEAGNWVDVTRQDIPDGLLYSWWSYRARDWDAADKGRRLDHVWVRGGDAHVPGSSRVLKAWRGAEKPSDHAPVLASFDL